MDEEQIYLFKLNAQPNILKKYPETLKNKLIPDKIFDTFNTLFTQVNIGTHTLNFSISRNYNEILESDEYIQLTEKTDSFIEQYKRITYSYKNNGDIYYSKDFLNLLDQLIEERKYLMGKFSVLRHDSKKFNRDDVIQSLQNEYHFQIDSEIGKGLDHIRRVQRLKMYANYLAGLKQENLEVDYDYQSEVLEVKDKNQIAAIDAVRDIEKKINSRKDDIKDISINPIVEDLVLNTTEKTKSVEIIVVYPNGSTDDEFDLLLRQAKQTSSKEIRSEFIAPNEDDNYDYLEQTKKLAEEPAFKGYLKDVKHQNQSIIDWELTTVRTIVKVKGS